MILPVINEETFELVKEKIEIIEDVATVVQIDFADQKITHKQLFSEYTRLNEIDTHVEYDLHLMVENPLEFLGTKVNNAVKVSTQIEVYVDVEEYISKAKNLDYAVGLSVGLKTPIEAVLPYLNQVHFIQFVAVDLGDKGSNFNPEVISKVKRLREINSSIAIQVDGGLREKHLQELSQAGVTDFAMGTAIFSNGNPTQKYIELSELPWIK